MRYLTVYITAKNAKEAEKISRMLLKGRLVACANIIPKIKSVYWWKGKLSHGSESLIIGKTKSSLKDDIIREVKKHHSYEVPCVNFLPIEAGNPDFLEWVEKETGKKMI